jgi:hypothetical protein
MPFASTTGLETSDYNADLHNEFHLLTMLLNLVTSINNNGGQPILHYDPMPYKEVLGKRLPSNIRMQDAVATLLVWNTEIVSVGGHSLSSHEDVPSSSKHQTTSSVSPMDSYQLFVIQQPEDPWLMKYLATQDNYRTCILVSGRSCLSSLEFKWDSLLSIP